MWHCIAGLLARDQATVSIEHSIFHNNTLEATDTAGAGSIGVMGEARVVVSESDFTNNTAHGVYAGGGAAGEQLLGLVSPQGCGLPF